jgi:hypothetical protein
LALGSEDLSLSQKTIYIGNKIYKIGSANAEYISIGNDDCELVFKGT